MFGFRSTFGPKLEDRYLKLRKKYHKKISREYFNEDPLLDTTITKTEEVIKESKVSTSQLDNVTWLVDVEYEGRHRYVEIRLLNEFKAGRGTFIYCPPTIGSARKFVVNLFVTKWMKKNVNVMMLFPSHFASLREYLKTSTHRFIDTQTAFASYVLAVEEAFKLSTRLKGEQVAAFGMSLGGIVLSWHAWMFNTLEIYMAAMAIPNLISMLFSKVFESTINKVGIRRRNPRYLDAFEIPPEELKKNGNKMKVILNSKDRYLPLRKSKSFWSKVTDDISVFPIGHFTFATMFPEIRRWIHKRLIDGGFVSEDTPEKSK